MAGTKGAPPAAHDDTDWDAIARMDPTVEMMQAGGVPLTPQNYIDTRWGAEAPEPWNEEAEMSLPGPFQIAHPPAGTQRS